MTTLIKCGLEQVNGQLELVAMWANGRCQRVVLDNDGPEVLVRGLVGLANHIARDIADGNIPCTSPSEGRVIKKGMNFWVNNKGMDFFGDADDPEFDGMDMRHVRVVHIENKDTITCRPAHGPNQTEDFIFDADQLIKMDGKFSA